MKTISILFSLAFLILVASCGRIAEPTPVIASWKVHLSGGKVSLSSADSLGKETEVKTFQSSIVKISVEKSKVAGGVGVITLEDTTAVPVSLEGYIKLLEVEGSELDVKTTVDIIGKIIISKGGTTIVTLDQESCSPFYLITSDASGSLRVEIWVPAACSSS